MTVQEYQADAIVRAAKTMAHYVQTTEADKRDWTPEVAGAAPLRSTLDMVGECIAVHGIVIALLGGQTPPAGSPFDAPRTFGTVEEGCTQLIARAEEFAGLVRAMTDEDLSREYIGRRGPIIGYAIIELPLRNTYYHCGQINLLQLLYGDAEFHPYRPA